MKQFLFLFVVFTPIFSSCEFFLIHEKSPLSLDSSHRHIFSLNGNETKACLSQPPGACTQVSIPMLASDSIIGLIYGLHTTGDKTFSLVHTHLEKLKQLTRFSTIFTQEAYLPLEKIIFFFIAPGTLVPFRGASPSKNSLVYEENQGLNVVMAPEYQHYFNTLKTQLEEKYPTITHCISKAYFPHQVDYFNDHPHQTNLPFLSLSLTPAQSMITINHHNLLIPLNEQGEERVEVFENNSEQTFYRLNNSHVINIPPMPQLPTLSRNRQRVNRQHPYDGWKRSQVRKGKANRLG